MTFKSSEYDEDRGGVEIVEVEDYLDCVGEARRLSGDSESIVDVGKYLACVTDARDLVHDWYEEVQDGA